MSEMIVDVKNVSKRFRLYPKPSDRLKEIILRKPYHHSHDALNNISFSVEAGKTLGIVGPNGAGKSTLLKLLTGILLPDTGDISTNGRVTGLLELGTGFNPDLSGRNNIELNGTMLGMSREELSAKEQDIIAFSELAEFIDDPLATYSSGMAMRLAFAIAIHADPACFIVDEALSVGDIGFQQKCMRRIRDFKKQGGAIVFVSHDMNAVKQLCDSAIMLDKGHVVAHRDPDTVVNLYNRLLAASAHQDMPYQVEKTRPTSHGTLQAQIKTVSINGSQGNVTVTSGDQLEIKVVAESHVELDKLCVGIIIRDQFGQDIWGTNSHLQGESLSISAGDRITTAFKTQINVGAGKYTVGAAIHAIPSEPQHYLNWIDNALNLNVLRQVPADFEGLVKLPAEVVIEKSQNITTLQQS